MKNWKTDFFRPRIPDASRGLREKYLRLQKKSELSNEAFARKVMESGLKIMEINNNETKKGAL